MLGYILYMRDPISGLYNEVYNGENGYPDINTFMLTRGIEAGSTYTFKVKGAYINGYTDESAITSIIACNSPSGMEAPRFVSGTSAGMTLAWQ